VAVAAAVLVGMGVAVGGGAGVSAGTVGTVRVCAAGGNKVAEGSGVACVPGRGVCVAAVCVAVEGGAVEGGDVTEGVTVAGVAVEDGAVAVGELPGGAAVAVQVGVAVGSAAVAVDAGPNGVDVSVTLGVTYTPGVLVGVGRPGAKGLGKPCPPSAGAVAALQPLSRTSASRRAAAAPRAGWACGLNLGIQLLGRASSADHALKVIVPPNGRPVEREAPPSWKLADVQPTLLPDRRSSVRDRSQSSFQEGECAGSMTWLTDVWELWYTI